MIYIQGSFERIAFAFEVHNAGQIRTGDAAGPTHRPPLVFQLAQPDDQPVIGGDDQSALSCRHGLVGRKREASRDAERAEAAPAVP